MNKSTSSIKLALFLVVAVCTQLKGQSGSIAGTLMDNTGKGVAGGEIYYVQQANVIKDQYGKLISNSSRVRSGIVKSDETGKFSIAGLPLGGYAVCAVSKEGATLSSCAWDPTPVQKVVEGKPIRDLTLKLYPTVPVSFTIVDPQRRILLPDNRGRIDTPARRFFLGIVSPTGGYHPAKLVSSSETGYVFVVHVPFAQKIRLLMDSELKVVSDQGDPLQRQEVTKFEIDTGTAAGRSLRLLIQ